MKNLYLFLALLLLKGVYGQETDPCDLSPRLGDYRRSINYTFGDEGEDNPVNDYFLSDGWYTFEANKQGTNMPTFPPPKGISSCGTYFPIWFDGTLPEGVNELVSGRACAISSTETCAAQYNIQIKKCSDDNFAYNLKTTSNGMAYCIGEEVKCPSETASGNGYTPGCQSGDFVTLHEDPEITTESITNDANWREVVLKCNIEHNETDIFVNVVWYYKNEIVYQVTDVPYEHLVEETQLREIHWEDMLLPGTVLCRVRAAYGAGGLYGPERSASYFMGLRLDTQTLTVHEGETATELIVRPTIPILCPSIKDDCELFIEVYEPIPKSGNGAFCMNGNQMKQTSLRTNDNFCNASVSMIAEILDNTHFTVPIYGADDSVVDGDVQVKLMLKTVDYNFFHEIWSNYTFPEIDVLVIDENKEAVGKKCFAKDDPHLQVFDGRRYENHMTGVYWFYRHKLLNIAVQVFFEEVPGKKYTQVCGAGIRSGNDLYIYDHCNQNNQAAREYMYECGDGHIVVNKSPSETEIILPNGAKVYLRQNFISMTPAIGDFEKVEGLCGRFNGKCKDDFVARDGSDFSDRDDCFHDLLEDCSNERSCGTNYFNTDMDGFNESWRVWQGESYFEGKLPDHVVPDVVTYCSCEQGMNPDDPPFLECNPQNAPTCASSNAGIVSGSECGQRTFALMSGAGSDDVIDEVLPFQYDPNYRAEPALWRDGWDENIAIANCQDFVTQLAAFDMCNEIPSVEIDIDKAIQTCALDIRILASTDLNIVHASGVLNACKNVIARNMSYFEISNTTVEPPHDMLADICPNNCYNQGICENGECKCNDPFFGDDCFYDENHVPVLNSIPNQGHCDLLTRPCQQTPVTGYYFLQKSSLTCHFQPILVTHSGVQIHQPEQKTTATFDHMERVMCPLPLIDIGDADNVLSVGYNVSVSNDGQTKSDTLPLITYNSVCVNCSDHFQCQLKASTCLIENACFMDQQSSPTDSCLNCQSSSNNRAWSQAPECQANINAGAIAGVVIGVVFVVSLGTIMGVLIVKKLLKPKTHVASTVDIDEKFSQCGIKSDGSLPAVFGDK